MKKAMYKTFLFLLIIFSAFMNTSCISFMVSSIVNSVPNKKIDIPFSGTMDTRFGYEDLYWGMTFDDASKLEGYPIRKNGSVYYYGYKSSSDSIQPEFYGHGSVNSTRLYFYNNRLYGVVDELEIKNPSLEYLHERYGDFSDENVVSQFENQENFSAIYTNENLFPDGNIRSLQIQIEKNGSTRVFIKAPYTERTLLLNSDVKNYLDGKEKLPANKWYMLGSTDGKDKDYDLVFLNRNEDDNYAVIYYRKNVDAVRSTVRAGIHIGNGYTNGTYEIKTKDGMREVKMDNNYFEFPIMNLSTNFTANNTISAREMLNIFFENENLTFRKNDKVSTLQLAGLKEIFAQYGITLEELDFAISNEEF